MFHAERNITREQTAKMLIDALEKETAEPEQFSYTDVANNRWSYRWVEAASKEGYMVGYNGGVFKPEFANHSCRDGNSLVAYRSEGRLDYERQYQDLL